MSMEAGKMVQTTQTILDIHILVVDDDATSLAVVSAMLKICKYQVVTVKNPFEALHTLRERKGLFDLVVTDLHMPQMDGLQLQKKVKQEFNLPVIMMSADEKPSVILKSLEEGVAFYMVKPINLDDLKHLWQYAISAKKITSDQTKPTLQQQLSSYSSSTSRSNEDHICEKHKNKTENKKKNKGNKNSIAIKKSKVIWTNSLHNQFLQAIKQIGLDKAVPKRILEFMNVPCLTRENVASHLQKYRIFLKRVAEKGACSMKEMTDYNSKPLRSSNFPSNQIPIKINFKHKFNSEFPNFSPNIQMGHSLNYQLQVPIMVGANSSYFNLPTINPNLEKAASSSVGNNNDHLLNSQANPPLILNNNIQFQDGHIQNNADVNNGGLSSFNDKNCETVGIGEKCTVGINNIDGEGDCEEFEFGSNQFLDQQMISDSNLMENPNPVPGSVLLPSEGGNQVLQQMVNNKTTWKPTDFDDYFEDFLTEQNYNNEASLQKENVEEILEDDLSEIWNQIEKDQSLSIPLSPNPNPKHFNQSWDHNQILAKDWDEILEMLFWENSS